MALSLLRHTTPEVAKGVCYGVTDLPLAASFEAEAQRVCDALPEVRCIVASPLQRCRQLAERIAAHASLKLYLSRDWQEMDFGSWEGLRWSAIPRHEIDAWAADFMGYRGHGGESVSQLSERIARALKATPEDALVVTHAGCIKAALALTGDPEGWNARPTFGSITRLDVRSDRFSRL
ncbi:alpha-ribazole phosphatase family protein [Cognatishimia sp. F0-27]|uniref:alpha-ribazole phosphatase family protein n=1 Tax=Cognatishimia sp. F0-27 TaxID=2816855 RepID=UPI001D0CC210|nr:alpha-ribazole phosphatase family protein [Cognatishimia sp. F0-27]MCC1493454.1 alpha-ribazole phosphatase family protein [Cognatishimia sp. F0-27]